MLLLVIIMKKEHINLSRRSGTPVSIRETLKKAVTELLVLLVLQKRPMYTYEMMREIETMSEGKISFNTLYQAIYRLQEFEFIVEQEKKMVENRVRIYFSVTREGEDYLNQLIAEYQSFVGAVNQIIDKEWNRGAKNDGYENK